MFVAMPVLEVMGIFYVAQHCAIYFLKDFFVFFEKILGRQNITYYLCAQLRKRQKTL